jgi:hypothetical protein
MLLREPPPLPKKESLIGRVVSFSLSFCCFQLDIVLSVHLGMDSFFRGSKIIGIPRIIRCDICGAK